MKRYEMVREIFNSCSGNQMRDVFISEIETDDVNLAVQEFLVGAEVQWEKTKTETGAILFDINTDGLKQRVAFTEIR